MPDYRAYAVWPDGNFEGFEALVCVDDDQAVKQVRCLVDRGPIELWSGERFITRIEHKVKLRPPPDAIMGLKTTPAPPSPLSRGWPARIFSLFTPPWRGH